jgi:hypothetical protein
MNGKQIACIVLLMFIGAMTYVAQIVHQKATAAELEAEEAAFAAEAMKMAAENADAALKKTQFESRDLRRFLEAWTPQINRMGSRQEVEGAIQANTRDKGVFVISQRFEDKSNSLGLMMPKSVMASMVVEDDFHKVMNWLGSMEQKLPLARVSSCRISAAATGRQIHVEVSLEVPLVNLSINPLGTIEKKEIN